MRKKTSKTPKEASKARVYMTPKIEIVLSEGKTAARVPKKTAAAPKAKKVALEDINKKINLLGKEKRSWWNALLKNHQSAHGEDNIPKLYQKFNKITGEIEAMGFDFVEIQEIAYKKDMSTVLTDMLSLLKKCPPQDRVQQFACLHQVQLAEHDKFLFIVPEMMPPGAELNELEKLKTSTDPKIIKKIVYRYLATQPYHLPISDYARYLNELVDNKVFANETKCKMAYILAKTTSAMSDAGFDKKSIKTEWEAFKIHFEELKSVERMKANRSFLARQAFEAGLAVKGAEGPRLEAIRPILDMAPIPPMSFLSKLLKTSEYKFLDPNLSLTQLQGVQAEMMDQMKEAARLYNTHPNEMMRAVQFIKTDTVIQNAQGSYVPDKKDILLVENFVHACQFLGDAPVLLSLLTTFHLEYLTRDELSACLNTYSEKLNTVQRSPLLPYALSLFQHVKSRELPAPLNTQLLQEITTAIVTAITAKELTTNQQVRLWVNDHYGVYFEPNLLLDIKDEVNINATLDERGIQAPETRRALTSILSSFNELEEEKEKFSELRDTLIEFHQTLSATDTTRFYDYCVYELKTHGLLSREKHDTPPSYLEQFQSLVNTLIHEKSIEGFEQFMELTREQVLQESAEGRNSLAKCKYLLTALYPALHEKSKIEAKEAFQFSGQLVCSSPIQVLSAWTPEISITFSEQERKEKLGKLKEKIELLHTQIESHYATHMGIGDDLITIKATLDEILELTPPHAFENYHRVQKTLNQVITENEAYTNDFNKKSFLQQGWALLSSAVSNIVNVEFTWEEKLWQAGLHSLAKPDGGFIEEAENAFINQGVNFEDLTRDLHRIKTEFIQKYPSLAARADNFVNRALQISPDDPKKNHTQFSQLIRQLSALDNSNWVLSLMYHYNGALLDRDIRDLAEIFNLEAFGKLEPETQKNVINALVTQLNNGMACPKDTIEAFIQCVHDHQDDDDHLVLNLLKKYYAHAPYPSLSTFTTWITLPHAEIEQTYHTFDQHPCQLGEHNGREIDNGFHREEALIKLNEMPAVQSIFTEDYLDSITFNQNLSRALSTEDLLSEIKKFKDSKLQDPIKLAMYSIELLHRCKGRTPEFVGNLQIPGRSFELNTTQILAILAMLETGNKVTAEIGTGEGKSRIMMILNACQFLKGNTVDFITSNLALAERDYLEALPFYESIGAKVNFITANSNLEDYQMEGINVSDPANMCLFRGKARSQRKSDLVLNPDPKKRALCLDEADVTYYDVSNKKFGYAREIPQFNIDILPVYSILMDFFAEEETEALYERNKNKCIETLLARIEDKNPNLYEIIQDRENSQFEKWLDAAFTARHLQYNVDYTVVTDAKTPGDLGDKKVAAARCLIGSRINEHAQFSEGVHQCLHAELNRIIKNKESEPKTDDLRLKQALQTCQKLNRTFHLAPESEITYINSSNAMLEDYQEGQLFAATGTLGIELEKLEAETNFGTKALQIPRHRGLKRQDRPTMILQNEDRQLETLVQHILTSRKQKQPILLMCKNDNQSQDFYDKLMARLQSHIDQDGLPHLTRIDAENYREGDTSAAKYLKDKGGRPGEVIITTEILGRGIEYELRGEAKNNGLKVLLTYLPKGQRDYGQNIGRGGRYGQVGESQLVLNREELKQDFGIDYLNQNLYTYPETFITRLQLFATYTKMLHRLFNTAFETLLNQYTEEFDKLETQNEETNEMWSKFLKKNQHSQNEAQNIVLTQLAQPKPDLSVIQKALETHEENTQQYWATLRDALKDTTLPEYPYYKIKKPKLLHHWFDTLQKFQNENKAFVLKVEQHDIRVQSRYERGYAGHTAIFKQQDFLERWKDNYDAWSHAEGLLLPNFHAWRHGALSTRNYLSQWPLLHYFIKPQDEERTVKTKIPSTYAALMEKLPSEETHGQPEEKTVLAIKGKEDIASTRPLVRPSSLRAGSPDDKRRHETSVSFKDKIKDASPLEENRRNLDQEP